jgi:hypothetical protein
LDSLSQLIDGPYQDPDLDIPDFVRDHFELDLDLEKMPSMPVKRVKKLFEEEDLDDQLTLCINCGLINSNLKHLTGCPLK